MNKILYYLQIMIVSAFSYRGRQIRVSRLIGKGYSERDATETVYARDLFRNHKISDEEVSMLLQIALLDAQKIHKLEKYELIKR